MTKRVLAWIRHGQYAQPPGVPSAHLPHGLTRSGQEQARAAAHDVWRHARDNRLELDAVIDSSRMRRAWETASLLGEELHRLGGPSLRVQEFDDLAERGLGAAANLSIDEIEALLAADPRFETPASGWRRDPRYVLPLQGAESLEQAGLRVAHHVMTRVQAASGGASLKLFVGHGGAFRHAAHVLGLLSSDEVQRLSMHNGEPLYFELQPEASGAAGLAPARLIQIAGEWRQRTGATPLD